MCHLAIFQALHVLFNPYIPYEVGSVFPSILHIRQVASPLTLSITICKIRTKK